ncbi:YkgJ family cysteine cluster protein [Pseudomonas fluorescens]|uniref:YkgJ family cysteine cluster protein n=1 Tax=Pseudomonas fluorescens TaxID=294 RepID=UPI0009BB25B2
MTPFNCTACGACCRHVDLSEQTRALDRGDGVCRDYNETTKLCRNYAQRPAICRVDVQFDLHYRKQMSWPQFCEVNERACIVLQEMG